MTSPFTIPPSHKNTEHRSGYIAQRESRQQTKNERSRRLQKSQLRPLPVRTLLAEPGLNKRPQDVTADHEQRPLLRADRRRSPVHHPFQPLEFRGEVALALVGQLLRGARVVPRRRGGAGALREAGFRDSLLETDLLELRQWVGGAGAGGEHGVQDLEAAGAFGQASVKGSERSGLEWRRKYFSRV